MKSLISMLVFTLALSVLPPAQAGPSERDRCDRAKDAAAAKHFGCRARIERTHLLDARSERTERKIAKCDAALRTSFYNRENTTRRSWGRMILSSARTTTTLKTS